MNKETELIIRPYEGVGPVKLGMTREEVRKAVGSRVETFYKTTDSTLPTDAFDSIGMHVYYKTPDSCNYIEFGRPAVPTFQNTTLLGRPYKDVRDFFLAVDPKVEFHGDGTGFFSRRFGIGIFAPCADDAPKDPVEGVSVFEPGYYDCD